MSKLNMDVQGRKLHFWFDTETWLAIEEEFGSLETMYELIDGKEKPMEHTMRMTAMVINAGARKHGEPEDMTPEWMRDHMTPKQVRKANTMAKLAIMEGWKRENVDEDDEGPVDVELENIQKKTEND